MNNMTNKFKKHETIGCCGIDCGLCPRFYTKGSSTCPGCGGLSFKEKHPSCGILTCCTIKNGFETCADCKDYPCVRLTSKTAGLDSFVTHRKMLSNLDEIKAAGTEQFIEKQKIRIGILSDLLTNFDDGCSKSFYCISCVLLPVEKLSETHKFAQKIDSNVALKEKSKQLKEYLTAIADELNIGLKLITRKILK